VPESLTTALSNTVCFARDKSAFPPVSFHVARYSTTASKRLGKLVSAKVKVNLCIVGDPDRTRLAIG
jgi:hypothetical protein